MQQPQAAIMTQQAILQRNTQWAGEQHLFLSSMRAMMAYIEGFVFAVTPLMGLLVCVGLFGVRLAFKYLMLLLWIQLWMPVLAINNLYITLVSQGAMAALSAPITSFTGIMESGTDSGILVRRRWVDGGFYSGIGTDAALWQRHHSDSPCREECRAATSLTKKSLRRIL